MNKSAITLKYTDNIRVVPDVVCAVIHKLWEGLKQKETETFTPAPNV
jgi:hypothetical protein